MDNSKVSIRTLSIGFMYYKMIFTDVTKLNHSIF